MVHVGSQSYHAKVTARTRTSFKKHIRRQVVLPVFAWLGLWAAINTGPSNLSGLFDDDMGLIIGLRAAAPITVMFFGGLIAMSAKGKRGASPTSPEILFWIYGIAVLAASLQADPWFNTAYWGFSFLAVLVGTRLFLIRESPLDQIALLNQLTWTVLVLVLLVLLFVAREVLFNAETGYGIVGRIGDVAGGAMSRSSGLARLAAIPAILAFVAFWRIHGLIRWVSAIVVFAGSFALIWFMQSRGAIFSLAFALAFIMLFMGKVPRYIGVFVLAIGLAGGLALIPEETREYMFDHVMRGTGYEGFQYMSGRTRIWQNAMQAIEEQPILGYGPQADRRIIYENAQSGPLYAWLCGGIIGLFGYAGGMLAAWWLFVKIQLEKFRLATQQRDMLITTGGILAFFTLRSYPENTAALFSIDLLVQFPAMLYIAILYRTLKAERIRQRRVAHRPINSEPSA